MIYYKANEEHKVLMHTNSAEMANYYRLTETCADDGLETAWDGSVWLKGYAPERPEPSLEERVAKLEADTGMVRWAREGILAEGSTYSDYAKAKAQEIEDLAQELRNL